MATIVVVEDQPDNLKLITALLTMKGHRVVGLTSGEPLVATLLAEQPPPRLVLLDIQLPGRDGYSVLADVKRIEGDHPWKVVALTAHAMPGDREKTLAAGFDGYLAPAPAERPLHITTREPAIHREGIVGGDGAVHRLRLHLCVELRWKLGRHRAVDRGGGNSAGITERFHADPHVAVHGLGLHRALGRHDVHVAAHRVDHQGTMRSRHVHIPYHGRGAQARVARQPHREVHGHVVAARGSQLDVALRRTATAVATPHGADGNATVVRYGDEAHTRGVRGPVSLHRRDLQRITPGRFDCHRPARVPDPHPLLRTELGAIRPRGRGRATRSTVVPSELAPQVAQSHGEVHHLFVHHAVRRVYCETDHEHGAKQRRPANDLFAPGVPECAHARSLLR